MRRSLLVGAPVAPLVLMILVACVPGGAPRVAPRGTLQPDSGDGPRAEEGPFAVVSASPQGETREVPEISLTFSRPLRSLDGSPPAPPVRLKPSVPGSWDWVGTRALRFSPERPLPMATEFEVEVAGARSVSGETLAEPYRFRFSTPRPRLVSASPHPGAVGLKPDEVVRLTFNQPVDDAAVRGAVRWQQHKGEAVAFDLRRPAGGDLRQVELVPRKPLPIHSSFDLRVGPELRGTEGPLEAGKERTLGFSTYGPLEATFECGKDSAGRCRPGGWNSVRLSTPVRRSDLKKALQIEPPVKLAWESFQNDKSYTTSLPLEGAFLPGRRYTVRLKQRAGGALLRDEYGQPLAHEMDERFEVGDLPPAFNIGVEGHTIEPSELREVPLFAMNLDHAEVAAAALDVASLAALLGKSDDERAAQVFDAPKARKVTVRPSAGRNRVHRQGIALGDLLAHGRGPVAVAARVTVQKREQQQFRLLQVTDLGLSAKAGPEGTLVWVTRLSTGLPVANAAVELYPPGEGKASATARTDASGLALLPAAAQAPSGDGEGGDEPRSKSALIVAREGDDWAYHEASDALYGWRYGAPYEGGSKPPTLGLLFTERGLYRPGDAVRIKGLSRKGTSKGMVTPAGQKARVVVSGPEGDKISEFDATLSAYGSFDREVRLPPGSKLGSYRVAASLVEPKPAAASAGQGEARRGDDEGEGAWYASFSVAEYRPAEFKVRAETDRPSYTRGDEIACSGRGDYLFGAPMAGSTARMSLSRQRTSFRPPGLDGYSTDDGPFLSAKEEASAPAGQIHAGEQKLNAQGEAVLGAKLELPGQQGPEVVSCEVDVMDLGHQSMAGSAAAVVHPGEVYAALRVGQPGFVEAGATIRPEVLAVRPDGQRKAGVAASIEVLERSYVVNRRASGDGAYHTAVEVRDKPVGSCKVTTAAQPQACELRLPGGGHYLVRATVADAAGRKVSASEHVYAVGSGSGGGWADRDDGSLKLITDKKSYRPGDRARVLIPSPFTQAEALVTVEREGILWQKVIAVTGGTPSVEIPVTEALMPNAFVSVLLLRGRTRKSPGDDRAPDLGAPTFRMGYAPLVVDTSSRRLHVEVKPGKSELHPGDELSVELSVRDAQGKASKAEVALYAVDEGVLSLTGYRTPDPVATFFAPRGVQVRTLESRESLARIARRDSGVAMGLDKGLDGGGGGDAPRRDFRQTAYFNPSIVTDEGGHARVSFKLPEGLTTYRLMAVAAGSDDRFGSSEAQVITSKPLMARPALPRQLRAGDSLEAGVVVTSKGLRGQFEVAFAAEGLTIDGEAKRSVALSPGQSQEVRFAARAPRAGRAKLRFEVRGEGASDSVEVEREVRTPTTIEATALYGDTGEAAGERLGDLRSLRDDVGGLEVSLSPTALAGLAGGVEQLIEYPYGCTEQLTSRLVPLLPLRDLAGALGLSLPEKVDEAVRATVGKVLGNQHSNGGFGLWPESTDSYPWLTAYALWGLNEAQRRGVPVRASATAAATRYLRDALSRSAVAPRDLAEQSFVIDVLADAGDADAGVLAHLFEQRAKMPPFARAQLLHALAASHSDASMIDALVKEVEAGIHLDGQVARVSAVGDEYDELLDSSTRTTALALRALVAARPAHPLAPKLALGLLHSRRAGRWRTTQETAWSLLALDAYRRAQEATPPDFLARVFLGQNTLLEERFQGRERLASHASLPMASLLPGSGQVLAFSKQGQGHLFYEARLRFARREMPLRPLDNGFFLDKSSRVVTPQTLRDAMHAHARGLLPRLTAGDLVLVDLTVVAPAEREFVVVDDPLPAGLEAVDTSLKGVSSALRDADEVSSGDDDDDERGYRWDAPVTRRELRDDRVVFFVDRMEPGVHHFRYLARATAVGSFMAPPARVEGMYAPETFGQTAGGSLVVASRP